MLAGQAVSGPAVLIEANATTIVEPGWSATALSSGDLILERVEALPDRVAVGTDVDPVQLEINLNLPELVGG